jgi:ligand-binding sensor domain-containing protein
MHKEKETLFTQSTIQTQVVMKRNYSPIYFLSKWVMVLLLSYVGSSSAQEYAFRNYSIGQGLSESVVNTLIQDEKGYIWMGTGFGLNRFDGHDFTIYLQENGFKEHPNKYSVPEC